MTDPSKRGRWGGRSREIVDAYDVRRTADDNARRCSASHPSTELPNVCGLSRARAEYRTGGEHGPTC
ncbi:MAG TPA: hypothetical protein VKF59_10425 [Candidatus Dormibacteraeota bacterium]|nr:hypothetical protein [Candidatus Dormibacteraeota bacterium]